MINKSTTQSGNGGLTGGNPVPTQSAFDSYVYARQHPQVTQNLDNSNSAYQNQAYFANRSQMMQQQTSETQKLQQYAGAQGNQIPLNQTFQNIEYYQKLGQPNFQNSLNNFSNNIWGAQIPIDQLRQGFVGVKNSTAVYGDNQQVSQNSHLSIRGQPMQTQQNLAFQYFQNPSQRDLATAASYLQTGAYQFNNSAAISNINYNNSIGQAYKQDLPQPNFSQFNKTFTDVLDSQQQQQQLLTNAPFRQHPQQNQQTAQNHNETSLITPQRDTTCQYCMVCQREMIQNDIQNFVFNPITGKYLPLHQACLDILGMNTGFVRINQFVSQGSQNIEQAEGQILNNKISVDLQVISHQHSPKNSSTIIFDQSDLTLERVNQEINNFKNLTGESGNFQALAFSEIYRFIKICSNAPNLNQEISFTIQQPQFQVKLNIKRESDQTVTGASLIINGMIDVSEYIRTQKFDQLITFEAQSQDDILLEIQLVISKVPVNDNISAIQQDLIRIRDFSFIIAYLKKNEVQENPAFPEKVMKEENKGSPINIDFQLQQRQFSVFQNQNPSQNPYLSTSTVYTDDIFQKKKAYSIQERQLYDYRNDCDSKTQLSGLTYFNTIDSMSQSTAQKSNGTPEKAQGFFPPPGFPQQMANQGNNSIQMNPFICFNPNSNEFVPRNLNTTTLAITDSAQKHHPQPRRVSSNNSSDESMKSKSQKGVQPQIQIHHGQIIARVITKIGSKEYQKLVERANPEIIEQIVLEIENNFSDLLVDHYGNYFCQKLFLNINSEQKMRLLKTLNQIHVNPEDMREKVSKKRLKTKFLFVSQDQRGTHAIQTFLEVLQEHQFKLVIADIIQKDLLKYAYNKNSNHVVIKFLKLTETQPYLDKIYELLVQNFEQLAQDANGLPIVKMAIQKFNNPELNQKIVQAMNRNAMALCQNAYGNYALQVALEYWNPENCEEFTKEFIPNLQQLAVQKFSSNVIEKALDKARQPVVELFANEVCRGDMLRVLVRVNYGYYVVERILMNCKNEELNHKLRSLAQKNLVHLGSNSLRNKWLNMLDKSQKGSLSLKHSCNNLVKGGEDDKNDRQHMDDYEDYTENDYTHYSQQETYESSYNKTMKKGHYIDYD